MVAKPDAGDIVAQTAVPILPDDTALEVFDKVTVAAEISARRVLPALIAGTAPRTAAATSRAAAISAAASRRTGASTGRSARSAIHNLVRAVAPPYPGAFTDVAGDRRASCARACSTPPRRQLAAARRRRSVRDWRMLVAHCGDGGTLRIDALEIDGDAIAAMRARASATRAAARPMLGARARGTMRAPRPNSIRMKRS